MRTIALLIIAVVAAGVAADCGPCDDATCEAAVCLPNDPYYCESGPSKGGCAPTAAAWNNTKFCTKCCSLAACPARFTCGACSQSTCESQSRCAIAYPFMCLSGTAAGGCSPNASYWPTQHMCNSCCDVKSCVHKCPPCTSAQCSANLCAPQFPYTCTAGPLKNGCSDSPTYFPDQSQCYSCCDASACPTPSPNSSIYLH